MPLPKNIENIRRNIFCEAYPSIGDWSTFPWHSSRNTQMGSDSDRLHSSQAFCISVWGTFAAQTGESVRSAVGKLVNDTGFSSAMEAAGGVIDLSLENVDRGRLNEHPAGVGEPTNLDVLIRLPNLTVAVESKLTEAFGSCSQALTRNCSGVYGAGSDLKMKSEALCRLDLADGRRQARSYWEVMRRISEDDAYPVGEPCAFAGSTYQLMRVIASAAQAGSPDWRALFAYPSGRGAASEEIAKVVRRLRPENRSRIIHLDYIELAQRLAGSADAVAQGLALHMRERLTAI